VTTIVEQPPHLGPTLEEAASLDTSLDLDRDLCDAPVGRRSPVPNAPIVTPAPAAVAFLLDHQRIDS
jgi:hypothetical protein